MLQLFRKAGWLTWCILIITSVVLMARLSLPYTAFKRNIDFLLTKQNVYHISYWRISFYLHVFASVFVLPAGLTQFNKYLLIKKPKVHRSFGMLYILVVLIISSPTGFLMALHANGGLPAKTSFIILSLAWFSTTLFALIFAKRKKFGVHGEWVLRSYALALSAITLRSYALLFDLLHFNIRPQEVYITIAWLSWVPNLVITEIMIRKGFVKRLLKR
jgi:hypothetical protein